MAATSWIVQIKAHSRYYPLPRLLDVLSLLPEETHCRSEPQFSIKNSIKTAPSSPMRSVLGVRRAPARRPSRLRYEHLIILGFTKHRSGLPGIPSYPSTNGHRVGGGSHLPPPPTERSVQISCTTLFGRRFTALREPAAPDRATAVVVGAVGPAP